MDPWRSRLGPAVIALACMACAEESHRCAVSSDCNEGRVCVANVCTAAPDGATDGATEALAPDVAPDVLAFLDAVPADAPPEAADSIDGGDAPPMDAAAPDVDVGAPDADASDADAPDSGDAGGDTPVEAWTLARIEEDNAAPSDLPSIAIHPTAGHLLVAWQEAGGIRLRHYDAAADTWAATQTIERRGSPRVPRVALAANGHALLVWRQEGSTDAALMGAWESHSDDGGVRWSEPGRIHAGAAAGAVVLALADNGDGRVAWEESAGGAHKLWTALHDGATGAFTMVDVLPGMTFFDPNEHYPVIAMDRSGAGILAGNQNDAAGNYTIFAAGFSRGTRLLPQLVTQAGSYVGNPAVAMANEGGHGAVAWGQLAGSTASLWVKPYDGGVWKEAQPVLTAPDMIDLVLAAGPDGGLTAAWTQPFAGGHPNVVSARYQPASGWGTAEPIETGNLAGPLAIEAPTPRLGADGHGNVDAIWRRKLGPGSFGIFASRLQDGAWSPPQQVAAAPRLLPLDLDLAVAADGRAALTFVFGDPEHTQSPEALNVFVARRR